MTKMKSDAKNVKPDYIFSVSWEVCNKVGGIYTVLSTQAKVLKEKSTGNLMFIGPDLNPDNTLFTETPDVYSEWRQYAIQNDGIKVRIGTWNIPGNPIVFLIGFNQYFGMKDSIYADAWNFFKVDSLHAYGDYDESSMFSYAAAKVVESFYRFNIKNNEKVVFHAHEWMTGLGSLFIKHFIPQIATVFTTHATTVGRSICCNYKPLYDYFEGYNGDQMAHELNVESKHSVEKQAALNADCFTTVSDLTARECTQFIGRTPEVVTVNGFEKKFVPSAKTTFNNKRESARTRILSVANRLMGLKLSKKTYILAIGGRCEFRNKGIDMFIESMKALRADARTREYEVLALINVPAWVAGPRADLKERMDGQKLYYDQALPMPYITHWLNNMDEDAIVSALRSAGFNNLSDDPVKIMFVPCYLDGNDGIFNKSYYDLLIGQDLALYPSYYEPWGYTPLESVAFHVPTITTDLAGFGLWVNHGKRGNGKLQNGVEVIHRSDSNFGEAVDNIKETVLKYFKATINAKEKMREAASVYAQEASWDKFILFYDQAYQVAMKSASKRK